MAAKIMAQKLFVFDLDGCLVDTIMGQLTVLRQVCAEMYGLPADKTEQKAYAAYLIHGCTFKAHAEECGHDAAWVAAKRHEMGGVFLARIHEFIQPCDVLQAQLGLLVDNGWTLGVLSQGGKAYLDGVLSYMEINDLFTPQLVMGFDCVEGHIKRTPEPYKRFLNRVEGRPTTLVMAEDTPENLVPAQQLGFQTALVGKKKWRGKVDYAAPDIKALLEEYFVPTAM